MLHTIWNWKLSRGFKKLEAGLFRGAVLREAWRLRMKKEMLIKDLE